MCVKYELIRLHFETDKKREDSLRKERKLCINEENKYEELKERKEEEKIIKRGQSTSYIYNKHGRIYIDKEYHSWSIKINQNNKKSK